MSKKTKGSKGNPYTWQEADSRCASNPLPCGSWFTDVNGIVCQIANYTAHVTTGEKTTGYMDPEDVITSLCKDGNRRESVRWEYHSPQRAELWNAAREANPRMQSPALAQRYALDIINGDWVDNPADCAVLDTASGLWNAGHRNSGVILAGIGIWMLVSRGTDPNDKEKLARMDRGRSRMQFSNIPNLFKECGSDEEARAWTAISTQFMRGPKLTDGKVRTDAEREAHIRKDIKSYVWLTKMVGLGSKTIVELLAEGRNSNDYRVAKALLFPTVLVAFLRAHIYYRENKDTEALARLDKMLPGYINGDLTAQRDKVASTLRTTIPGKGTFPYGIKEADKWNAYNRTERAIEAFVAKESEVPLGTRNRKTQKEIFVLSRELQKFTDDDDDESNAPVIAS